MPSAFPLNFQLNWLAISECVLSAREHFHVLEHDAGHAVFGQHAADGLLNQQFGLLVAELVVGLLAETAGVFRICLIGLLLALVAGHLHFGCIGDDDKVAAVNVRGPVGTVLAHEAGRDFRREATEADAIGINNFPVLSDVTRLVQGRIATQHKGLQRLRRRRVQARTARRQTKPETAEAETKHAAYWAGQVQRMVPRHKDVGYSDGPATTPGSSKGREYRQYSASRAN